MTRNAKVRAALVLASVATLAAREILAGPRAAGQFATGIDLVEVYATVTDANGQVVTGLGVDDFQVSEDGRPQAIAVFAASEFPLAVAVGIDRSFSMTVDRLSIAKSAARAFIKALRPDDQVMVMAIGSAAEASAPLSADHATAIAAIERLDRWGTTPLYDATVAVLNAIQPAKGRRALVLLSDESDRYSRTSATDLIEQARGKDVLVYPIAVGRSPVPIFVELAAVTGGRSFLVRDSRQAESAVATIARELRFQYLLGYQPVPLRQGGHDESGWRSIHVSVRRPHVRVRARDGYLSR